MLFRSATVGFVQTNLASDVPGMANFTDPGLVNAWGIIASGPGGAYRSTDGETWEELKLWRELETGPADFLHAYWMGRYYGFLP